MRSGLIIECVAIKSRQGLPSGLRVFLAPTPACVVKEISGSSPSRYRKRRSRNSDYGTAGSLRRRLNRW